MEKCGKSLLAIFEIFVIRQGSNPQTCKIVVYVLYGTNYQVLDQLHYKGYLKKLSNFSYKFVFTSNLLQQVRIANAASNLMTPLSVQRRPLWNVGPSKIRSLHWCVVLWIHIFDAICNTGPCTFAPPY